MLDKCIWGICVVWLIVDSLTGYYLNQDINFPASQILKLIALILVVIRLSKKKKYIGIYIAILLYISIYTLNLIFQGEDLAVSLLHLSKPLTTLMLFIYFQYYAESHSVNMFVNKCVKVFLVGFIVLELNVIIGVLGFGFYTYKVLEIGYKGFFYAGNELGGVVLVLYPVILLWAYEYNKLIFVLLSLCSIYSGILIGTKTCILIPIISTIVIPFLYGSLKMRIKFISYFTIIVIAATPFIISQVDISEIDTISKIVDSTESQDASSTVFSGRNEYWNNEKEEFFQSPILVQLFGLGGNRSVEMDPMDVLLNYGYLGVLLIYSFLIWLLIRTYRCLSINRLNKLILFIDIMLIGLSSIAGHILFSTMAGLYIALVNSLIYTHIDSIKQITDGSDNLKPLSLKRSPILR